MSKRSASRCNLPATKIQKKKNDENSSASDENPVEIFKRKLRPRPALHPVKVPQRQVSPGPPLLEDERIPIYTRWGRSPAPTLTAEISKTHEPLKIAPPAPAIKTAWNKTSRPPVISVCEFPVNLKAPLKTISAKNFPVLQDAPMMETRVEPRVETPQKFAAASVTEAELFLPAGQSANYGKWRTHDLLAWLENFYPYEDYKDLHNLIKKEQLDGYFVFDVVNSDAIRRDLDIPFGPWRKIRHHALAVLEEFKKEKSEKRCF